MIVLNNHHGSRNKLPIEATITVDDYGARHCYNHVILHFMVINMLLRTIPVTTYIRRNHSVVFYHHAEKQ